jgi:tetratricopeptide (TPR) repeat protein
MKRSVCLVLGLIFVLSVTVPAFSQGGENAAWQAIQDERDTRRRGERLESFIGSYRNSPYRPEADKMLVTIWADNKDYQKIILHADTNFRLQQTSADSASKAFVYTQALLASVAVNNMAKVNEFSKYVLEVDPNNLQVLILLAGSNLPDAKTAMTYAQRAVAVPRPATMNDAQWQTMQFRAHSILGGFYLAENKLKEAMQEFSVALSANPKDHVTQYRSGFISANLAVGAAQAAQAANDELIKAIGDKASNEKIAELTEKQKSIEKEALSHRDSALDSLAKAVVLTTPTSPFAEPAKKMFDSLYMSKNRSMEGVDQFLAQKKTELGL